LKLFSDCSSRTHITLGKYIIIRGGFNGRSLVQWLTRPLEGWALEAPGARGQWRLSLSPDGATEPWSIWGGERKNTRIRTHFKHILNVITLKYNSKHLIIQKITNKFPSSVFNHRLNTLYQVRVLTAIGLHYH